MLGFFPCPHFPSGGKVMCLLEVEGFDGVHLGVSEMKSFLFKQRCTSTNSRNLHRFVFVIVLLLKAKS